jgi:membrane-associated phospholipid phosphatase
MYTFGNEHQNNTEADKAKNGIVPWTMVFYNIGWNVLHSFTYNYGLNFIGAGLGTWAFIESDADWKWRNIAYEHEGLYKFGIPALYIGYIVPAVTPVAVYISGLETKDEKLQITGLALVQSLALTLSMQTVFKMITGRPSPGLITAGDEKRFYRQDDFSREFDWFNMNFVHGWPSGHSANAFAAAAVITEIYHENIYLKIGLYTYAAFIGFSSLSSFHWASESFAGALIGYAIGKTIGKSYRKYIENKPDKNNITLYVTTNSVGILVRI